MKFNEKLMELRKRQGLSQEELGYKLNVTRQTVSKWELGQTTPEMDKLLELSKLFNISVDDLISDSDLEKPTNQNTETIIEDQQIKKQEGKNNKLYSILIIALIVVIILIVVKGISGITASNKETNSNPNILERFFGLFDRTLSMQEEIFDEVFEQQTNIMEESDNSMPQINISQINTSQINTMIFNKTLEIYKGSAKGSSTKKLLTEIITINEKEERKVIVKYGEIETQDPEEIKTLKMNIKDSNNFEVSFKYNTEGFIEETILERVYTESEKNSFNSSIEMYIGTNGSSFTGNVLDEVMTKNKKEERKITVKYGNIETQDEAEIRKIKKGFDTFNKFEVYVEYDEIGFINKVIIEKI